MQVFKGNTQFEKRGEKFLAKRLYELEPIETYFGVTAVSRTSIIISFLFDEVSFENAEIKLDSIFQAWVRDLYRSI